MANKKDFTIEELEQKYAQMSEECKAIGEQIAAKKKEEKERREAELALAKELRKKEVDEAFENYNNLLLL